MIRRATACIVVATLAGGVGQAAATEWAQLHAIERTQTGFKTTAADPWLLSEPLINPVPDDAHCLLLEIRTSQPTPMQLFWLRDDEILAGERSVTFHVNSSGDYTLVAVSLDAQGTFEGLTRFRLDPGHGPGIEFDIRRLEFVHPTNVPPQLLPGLINFHCFTSKLHYQPGERIEYRATLVARNYPDQQSSKIIELTLRDADNQPVTTLVQQYGIRNGLRFKEIQGVLDVPAPLTPGRYTLEATSTDQRSGLTLKAEHVFGVQGPDDPFVYETPFKFVKDFSIVRGPKGRWHIFSITGDMFANHDWSPNGQERTFSHASSANLRDWTIHPPVLSISDEPHPDGNGRFKDRNIWAPHVIEHDGQYWMFYTSVNTHVSQSVSLATSPDLFNWTECESNPVFTLEGVEWANWGRDHWSDCRDPAVLADGDKFYMYVTANVKPPGEVGAVVVAESDDLIHWTNPAIAVRGKTASESPQVWKVGDTYCMTTSSIGGATYTSAHPVTGWQRTPFPRPDIQQREKYVNTSPSFAEEVVPLGDGTFLMAGLTWRHWGNSIYIFRTKCADGVPAAYESPWQLGIADGE